MIERCKYRKPGMRLLICSLVLLQTLSAAGDPRIVRLAREAGSKGWIVYSAKTEKGDWDLFLMRPDGSHRRNITNTPGTNEIGARFSPDGKRILFRRIPLEIKFNHDWWGRAGRLVIAGAGGSNPVDYGEIPWASWGPDGRQLACLTRTGIEIRDTATRQVLRTLDRKGIYQQLYWSPDGKWFTGTANAFGEVWTVVRLNAATGEVNAVAKFQNCTPDWFPDSQRIIYSSRPANQEDADLEMAKAVGQPPGYGWTQLWSAKADGSQRSLIYGEDGKHVYAGALSPDGKYVLFTLSTSDGNEAAAEMRLMRMSDTPAIGGVSKALRKLHPHTKDGPVLPLGLGWEPHWTYTEIGGGKR